MTAHRKSPNLLVLSLLLLIGGGLAGTAFAPRQARAEQLCPKKACNTESGECFNTDINYKCDGTGHVGGTGPSPVCASSAC
jgi:hypothetical protein